eukprot:2440564-Pyramimonas_sp.AAC.1
MHLYPQTYRQNESVDDPYLVLHTVKGRPQRGLIIDPGAAGGLLGTKTLLEWKRDIYDERGLSYQLEPSNASFTGINGQPYPSRGSFLGPILVEGMERGTTYRADLIGGPGSRCPGLLPNSTMFKHKCILFENMYDNGDGILASVPGNKLPAVSRAFLTDSGHYLLP